MTDVVLGSQVQSLSYASFSGCTGLKSLTVPASVSWVEGDVFDGCANLTTIIWLGDCPSIDTQFPSPSRRFSSTNLVNYILEDSFGWKASLGERPVIVLRDDLAVSNVQVNPSKTQDGMVEIDFTVNGSTALFERGPKLSVALQINDGTRVYRAETISLTGRVDRVVNTRGDYRLVWDARSDLGEMRIDNVEITILLEVHETVSGGVRLWENGPYFADRNVGAASPEDYGYYFWWGDTVGCIWVNDRWKVVNGAEDNFYFSDYNSEIYTYNKRKDILEENGWISSRQTLTPAHDAATVYCGTGWRMPTNMIWIV